MSGSHRTERGSGVEEEMEDKHWARSREMVFVTMVTASIQAGWRCGWLVGENTFLGDCVAEDSKNVKNQINTQSDSLGHVSLSTLGYAVYG